MKTIRTKNLCALCSTSDDFIGFGVEIGMVNTETTGYIFSITLEILHLTLAVGIGSSKRLGK